MTDDGNGDRGLVDGRELGMIMVQQLGDLVESWAHVLEAVAEQGVDPSPLMKVLAGTLRATAEQLDPSDQPPA
ncbi:MAG TPA: hypothetical protein VIL36_23565 [Acidimicrobiales bacterium]